MDFWTRLLGVEVAENTTLKSAEITLRGFVPWWLAVLGLAVLAGFVFYLYTLEKGTLGWPRRILLVALRVSLLVLLVLLLFRPVLLAEFQGERLRRVLVLVDNSLSMSQQDHRLTEADQARVAVAKGLLPLTTNIEDIKSASSLPSETPKDPARKDMVAWMLENKELKLFEELGRHGPLQVLLFGPKVHGIDQGKDVESKEPLEKRVLADLGANEQKTALADALFETLQLKEADLPAAVVIVTDGQDNASKFTLQEAARECARIKVPVHIWGVGTAQGGTLELKEMAAPDTLFVDDTVTIPLRWRAQGFKKGTLELTLTLGGKKVAQREIPLATGDDLREALTFTVEKGLEKRQLAATIAVKDSDQFRDTQSKQVRVVDSKIKVLVIENAPRFEYKFLQPALLRDRRIEPTFLLAKADPKVANGGPPYIPSLPATRDKFFEAKYNLIVLGDVAPETLGAEHLEWIKEYVANGGGLIVVAGRQHMPADYLSTKFKEILPIEAEATKFPLATENRTQEYPPTLTEVGKRTDMLALDDVPELNLKTWQSLPGFHWQYPVRKLKPGALALVVNPRAKMGDQPMPVLVSHHYGKGQVLFCGTDETWRWRFNVEDKFFVRYWGQLIYQMGLPHLLGNNAQRAQFGLEHAQAILDQPGSIYVRLLDKDFLPRKDPVVEAEIEYLGVKSDTERLRKIQLHAIAGRPGDYRALLPHDKPGRFEIRVKNPESYSFQYRVDPPAKHELEKSGMAEKALQSLAEQSEGKFYREENLYQLPHLVRGQKAPYTLRQEVILWNPLAMLLFVLLLSVEWLVRKFSNLS